MIYLGDDAPGQRGEQAALAGPARLPRRSASRASPTSASSSRQRIRCRCSSFRTRSTRASGPIRPRAWDAITGYLARASRPPHARPPGGGPAHVHVAADPAGPPLGDARAGPRGTEGHDRHRRGPARRGPSAGRPGSCAAGADDLDDGDAADRRQPLGRRRVPRRLRRSSPTAARCRSSTTSTWSSSPACWTRSSTTTTRRRWTRRRRSPALDPDRAALLLGEALDVASHRFDAWVTSLATRRLSDLRSATPDGRDARSLRRGRGPRAEARAAGGRPAACGRAHPAPRRRRRRGLRPRPVAGPGRDGGGAACRPPRPRGPRPEHAAALAIDLSSSRVRTALGLLDGVREGQSLGALLGYRAERLLHERGAHTAVEVVRRLAPPPVVTATGTPEGLPPTRGLRRAGAVAHGPERPSSTRSTPASGQRSEAVLDTLARRRRRRGRPAAGRERAPDRSRQPRPCGRRARHAQPGRGRDGRARGRRHPQDRDLDHAAGARAARSRHPGGSGLAG